MRKEKITGEMIASRIRECLSEGWSYEYDPEKYAFYLTLELSEKVSLHFTIQIAMSAYSVYFVFPLTVDVQNEEQVRSIAEFICRVNYGLRNGNFEFDFDSGKIRYKTYTNCLGQLPSKEVVAESLIIPYAMFTHYTRAILQVLCYGVSPSAAADFADDFDEDTDAAEMAGSEDERAEELAVSMS